MKRDGPARHCLSVVTQRVAGHSDRTMWVPGKMQRSALKVLGCVDLIELHLFGNAFQRA